jgi:hypothetical protein
VNQEHTSQSVSQSSTQGLAQGYPSLVEQPRSAVQRAGSGISPSIQWRKSQLKSARSDPYDRSTRGAVETKIKQNPSRKNFDTSGAYYGRRRFRWPGFDGHRQSLGQQATRVG